MNGTFDPGALDIEIDVWTAPYATPANGGSDIRSFVRLYGVPLSLVQQSNNLNTQPIAIYAGMSPGLPLASAAANQAGLIAQGTIYPATGNWIGTTTTLDLYLAASAGSNYAPANISSNWKKGTTLGSALQTALKNAFPNATLSINVSNNLVLNQDQPFAYGTLQQVSTFARSISQKILGDTSYMGVQISQKGNTISVSDGTTNLPAAKKVAFQDMIGQPTWFGNQVSFKTVMRADLNIGDVVMMPNAIQVVDPQAAILSRNSVAFAGNYIIQSVHHMGRYRQADAASWVTVFTAVPTSQTTKIGGQTTDFQ